jgi:exodeoxyribonuclease V alpha subunit
VEDKLIEFLQPSPLPPTHASKETKERLCEEQIAAVESALNNTVSIITGGAGCGKTTVISAIAHEFELRDIPYCIASFTGKAVARIKEVVQRRENILTLHMILSRGKLLDKLDRPMEVLIIDEISMVPNELLAKVLAKLHYTLMDRNGKVLRVVMVGDSNQVQSIEWGDFFNQVLTSRIFKEGETQGRLAIPCVQLTEDHRRKEKGVLFSNMAQFATAESPDEIVFEWGKDCQFVQGGIDQIESTIRSIYMMGIPHEEITVISPVNQGLEEINTRCQNVFLNKDTVSIRDSFGKLWKLGARVMMTVNRYDINVMNGEEGIIIGILANRSCVKVRFKNGQEVDFPTFTPVIMNTNESDEEPLDDQPLSTKLLTLSWAITVHKSQGSQWRYVIFYIPHNMSKGSFFNRKLLYTGISRTREMLYVVANCESVFLSSIFVNPSHRYDNLSKRLTAKPFVDRYVDQTTRTHERGI